MKTTSQSCPICGINEVKKGKKFCSMDCYRTHQRSGNYKTGQEAFHIYNCHECGVETRRRPSQKRNGEQSDKVFCGRDCYSKHHAMKFIDMNCEGCGGLFSQPKRSKLNKFCDIKCRRKIRVSKCKSCGCEFSAISYRDKLGVRGYARVVKSVCSKSCQSDFYKNNIDRKQKISKAMTGENHPNYIDGYWSSLHSRGRMWSEIRKQVFRLKGNSCIECGMTKQESLDKWGCDINIDHITPWDSFTDEREANRVENLRPLCKSCHAKVGSKVMHGKYKAENRENR